MRLIFIACFLFHLTPIFAQVNKDSLWGVWEDEMESDSMRSAALLTICNYWLDNSQDSALFYIKKGISFALKHEYDNGLVFFMGKLGQVAQNQGNIDSAIAIFQQGKALSDSINFIQGSIRSRISLAYAYQLQGRNNESLDQNNEALAIAKETNDKKSIAKISNNIGIGHFHQGNFDRASKHWRTCLKISEEIGFINMVASAYHNLGNIYFKQEDLEKAKEYYEHSLNLYEGLDDKNGMALLLSKMAMLQMFTDENAGLEIYEKSLEIAESIGTLSTVHGNLVNLAAHFDWQVQDHEKAMEYDQRSLEVAYESGDQRLISHSLMAISVTYFLMENYDQGIKIGLQAIESCKQSNSSFHMKTAAEVLYECYSAKGNYKDALAFYKVYVHIRDSIYSESNNRAVLRHEYAYEYEKQKITDSLNRMQEILQADLNYQKEIGRKNQTRNILIGSMALVLLLAGGGWSRARFVKKSNERLAIEKERAEKSEAFKQDFLANMSHEIRTPMNAVLGITNLTLDTKLTQKQRDYLEAVRNSSESLLFIINDILDLSKLEAEGMILESRAFNVNALIEQVYNTLRFSAEGKALEFKTHIAADLPEYLVGDDLRLNQILVNLCGNAIKFTEKGSIELSVKKVGGQIQFAVKDTGIGLSMDQKEAMFAPFKQADSGTTRKYGGTGLGLSISKSLVELMGSVIEVQSEVGQGSTFSFILNLQDASQAEIANLEREKHIDLSALKGIRILLAEDNKYNVIVVNDTLINLVEDVRVDVAENGKVVLEKLMDNEYDVILMDSDMPIMDGREATRKIRQLDNNQKNIPIIALTSSVLASEIEKCLEAGMNDSIPKPFQRDQFFNTISKYYHKKGHS